MFDVLACVDAANCGRLDDWVDAYLSAGDWANAGLREGLRLQRRYWIGPLLLPLSRLERCCGPEPGMKYPIAADAWQRKVGAMASNLADPMGIPPLIIEWRAGALMICDGSHRHAAMTAAGWDACWAIVWCNSVDDYRRARQALDADSPVVMEKQFEHLRRNGWARFPAAVSDDLVAAAMQAIQADLANNYDPERQSEYDSRSYCQSLRNQPPIAELLSHSSARSILDRALGWDEIEHDHGQIAIRRARNIDKAHPPTPHIDGSGGRTSGGGISNFTALVGVYLTRVNTEFAGNFTVWPGSHHLLEAYFRDRGPQAMQEGMPRIGLGNPIQLFVEPGDVVLCHYQLAHTAVVNLSTNDRIAIYFRVWLKGIEERRWELLSDIWQELPKLSFSIRSAKASSARPCRWNGPPPCPGSARRAGGWGGCSLPDF
jgi:hypothetical protein